jgi:hypothetical protein
MPGITSKECSPTCGKDTNLRNQKEIVKFQSLDRKFASVAREQKTWKETISLQSAVEEEIHLKISGGSAGHVTIFGTPRKCFWKTSI